MRDNLSCAEVLKDNRKELRGRNVETKVSRKENELATLILNRKVSDSKWLERSALGVLKDFSSVARVNKRADSRRPRGGCSRVWRTALYPLFVRRFLGGPSGVKNITSGTAVRRAPVGRFVGGPSGVKKHHQWHRCS
ncbi:hypothetical protein LWI29_037797 [Acer saccharum]|uniref:Uncharacterized protein n=1 Tax=Acer saccharum TaxID=4024 RepID=A0AA39RGF9_ACESA|nr:hypothetical protein LWI29_037797 [Acer saccharum]